MYANASRLIASLSRSGLTPEGSRVGCVPVSEFEARGGGGKVLMGLIGEDYYGGRLKVVGVFEE